MDEEKSLRAQVVEAGAQNLIILGPLAPSYAETVLDAILDVLSKNTDEWRTAAIPDLKASQPTIAGLLAVLREGDEG